MYRDLVVDQTFLALGFVVNLTLFERREALHDGSRKSLQRLSHAEAAGKIEQMA